MSAGFFVSSISEINAVIRNEMVGYYSEVSVMLQDIRLPNSNSRARMYHAEEDIGDGWVCAFVAGGRYFQYTGRALDVSPAVPADNQE